MLRFVDMPAEISGKKMPELVNFPSYTKNGSDINSIEQ